MNGNNFLYPDFLSDAGQYHAAEASWRQLWAGVMLRTGQTDRWATPWLNTEYADGTQCLDGNPIFSALCAERKLAIRVIQLEREQDLDNLSWWIDKFAAGEPDEITGVGQHFLGQISFKMPTRSSPATGLLASDQCGLLTRQIQFSA